MYSLPQVHTKQVGSVFSEQVCVSWLSLTSRLSGSVHRDLDGSLVRGHLRRVGEHRDGQGETLPCGGRRDKRERKRNRK